MQELTARNSTLKNPVEHETLLNKWIVKWKGTDYAGVSVDEHSNLSYIAALQELKDEGAIDIRKELRNGKVVAMHSKHITLDLTPRKAFLNSGFIISLKAK